MSNQFFFLILEINFIKQCGSIAFFRSSPLTCLLLARVHFVLLVSRSLDSSHSRTSPLSSTHSSQDSLHKQTKKKSGIKSSLGRIFSKKEKTRKDYSSLQRTNVAMMHPPPPDVTSELIQNFFVGYHGHPPDFCIGINGGTEVHPSSFTGRYILQSGFWERSVNRFFIFFVAIIHFLTTDVTCEMNHVLLILIAIRYIRFLVVSEWDLVKIVKKIEICSHIFWAVLFNHSPNWLPAYY